MAQQDFPKAPVERRCPNCGTRVAVEAESCFMCGYDLRISVRRKRKISIVDILLVVAVFVVLVFWWQLGRTQRSETNANATAILPRDVPVLTATVAILVTPIPPSTSAPEQMQSQVIQQTHIVQQGETLLAIANQYQVSVEEIQSANSLPNELIREGQRLIIPKTIQVPVNNSANSGVTSGELSYTVLDKDTIYTIAGKFGSTADEILAINNLAQNDIIRPGQVLRIPIRQAPLEVFNDSGAISGSADTVIHPAPNLTGPPNNEPIAITQTVLLRWVSVDLLAANEWYVVQIIPAGGSAKVLNTVWTKSNSHKIDIDFAPVPGDSATYSWQITVVRVAPGNRLEAASPASEQRQFRWQ